MDRSVKYVFLPGNVQPAAQPVTFFNLASNPTETIPSSSSNIIILENYVPGVNEVVNKSSAVIDVQNVLNSESCVSGHVRESSALLEVQNVMHSTSLVSGTVKEQKFRTILPKNDTPSDVSALPPQPSNPQEAFNRKKKGCPEAKRYCR